MLAEKYSLDSMPNLDNILDHTKKLIKQGKKLIKQIWMNQIFLEKFQPKKSVKNQIMIANN
jgi:hypothetical protein